MKLQAEELTLSNSNEWDAYLEKKPIFPVFQSSRMFQALRQNPYYKPYGMIFRDIDCGGEIVAGYVFFVVQEIRGLASLLTTRIILNGGPVIKNGYESCLVEILADLRRHPGLKGTYFEIWHEADCSAFEYVFKSMGFTFAPHLNFLIDLSQGFDAVWNPIHGRKKWYIKKNSKILSFRLAQSTADIELFYSLLKETYSRIKLPLIDYSVFEDLFKNNIGLFILAEKDGVGVACRLVLNFNTSLYDWFAGSVIQSPNLHANESVVWWVLDYGLKNGYTSFDFGGAGRPDEPYGVRDFKAEFGGTLVNYGRHKQILSPIKEKILESVIAMRAHWINSRSKKGGKPKPSQP